MQKILLKKRFFERGLIRGHPQRERHTPPSIPRLSQRLSHIVKVFSKKISTLKAFSKLLLGDVKVEKYC